MESIGGANFKQFLFRFGLTDDPSDLYGRSSRVRVLTLPRGGADASAGWVAATRAVTFHRGARMLHRFDVDWEHYGYDESAQRELVEFTLRTMLSFFVAPNQPTRTREELRCFLKRWLGGTILAQQYWSADEFGREPV